MNIHKKGFILIEVLAAGLLLSLAGSGLYAGLTGAVRTHRAIRESNAVYDPLRILWMKTEKDLRNAVVLREYRFRGGQDEIHFPVVRLEKEAGERAFQILLVHYFMKDGNLMRGEEKLPKSFVREPPFEKIVLKGIERIRFQYAYLDENEEPVFKPFWLEEPYFGIPKAVTIEMKLKKHPKTFSRLIPIPQGRWGHVQAE